MKNVLLFFIAIAISSLTYSQIDVNSTGNVGIGITNSTNKLHVGGNTVISGNLGIGTSPTQRLTVYGNSLLNGTVTINPTGLLGYNNIIIDNHSVSTNPTLPNAAVLYPGTNSMGLLGEPSKRFYFLFVYDIYYQTLNSTSDIRLKENIRLCPPLLSKVREINSYNFNFNEKYYDGMSEEQIAIMKKTKFGFIAQEIQEIFPELVSVSDSAGMLALDYVSMIPILTAAIKEQQEMIDAQAEKIIELEKLIVKVNPKTNEADEINTSLKFNLSKTGNYETEDLKVYQNAPNPFNENTYVRCYIPKTFSKVQLCIFNMQGVQLKCLNVEDRGAVEILIEAGAFVSGIYTYLLIGDGKTSEAKNMILTK